MSDEEMNKKMEFIVEQHEKFAAEIQILREVQATQYGRLSDALISLVGIVGNLVQAQTRTDDNINRLTEAQSRTDERLNIVISVVERYFGGNGGAETPA